MPMDRSYGWYPYAQMTGTNVAVIKFIINALGFHSAINVNKCTIVVTESRPIQTYCDILYSHQTCFVTISYKTEFADN